MASPPPERQSQEAAPRVSDREIDYARFVLYVRRGVPVCDHLARLASRGGNDVIIQDVDHITGPRPAWLRGVPSLVELPSYKLHTGTDAVQKLEAFLHGGVQAMGADLLGGAGSRRAAPLQEGFAADSGPHGLAISPDERYEDAPRQRSAGGASLEEMIRLRARGGGASAQP
jgi:hypothetical protein